MASGTVAGVSCAWILAGGGGFGVFLSVSIAAVSVSGALATVDGGNVGKFTNS